MAVADPERGVLRRKCCAQGRAGVYTFRGSGFYILMAQASLLNPKIYAV